MTTKILLSGTFSFFGEFKEFACQALEPVWELVGRPDVTGILIRATLLVAEDGDEGMVGAMAFPSLEDLNAFPGLAGYLQGRAWEEAFDVGALSRSRGYVTGPRIREIFLGTEEGEIMLVGVVMGSASRTYETSVVLSPPGTIRGVEDWECSSWCTCPVNFDCKHGAAVLGKLTATAEEGRDGNIHSGHMGAWLRQLQLGAESSLNAPSKDKPGQAPAPSKVLVYCLEDWQTGVPGTRLQPTLRMRTAGQLKTGKFRVSAARAKPDPMRPQKYMQREDRDWVARLDLLREEFRSSKGSYPMTRSKDWGEVMEEVAAARALVTAGWRTGATRPWPGGRRWRWSRVGGPWRTGRLRPEVRSAEGSVQLLPWAATGLPGSGAGGGGVDRGRDSRRR